MTEQHQIDAEQAALLIERLVQFSRQRGMVEPMDESYVRNLLLDLFRFNAPHEGAIPVEQLDSPISVLEPLLDYAVQQGLIPDETTTQRDLFDARLMGLLVARPSAIIAQFDQTEKNEGIEAATKQFYQLNMDSNYIQMGRIRKNQYWLHQTSYGNLEITINLSKPEKDPKEIALLKTMQPSHYPKCLLCESNVGYAGRADHPGRQNLRVLPLTLQGEQWHFQYSPYVYYNEHSIVFKGEHSPMRISHATFVRLLDFIDRMPHYFIGSNADLPIVGGSILNHDHFQAGRHTFPMEEAPVEAAFTDVKSPGVRFGIVRWPLSVIRVIGKDRDAVLASANRILDAWREYSDAAADIYAYSDAADGGRIPHNTITPIARLRGGEYELDLVLRNNRTSEAHPDGIFHPHQELHHIKKENIGLIEVMGLAVLPGRLKAELDAIAAYLTGQRVWTGAEAKDEQFALRQHASWIEDLLTRYGNHLSSEEAADALRKETGDKFHAVLQDAGVYKTTDAGRKSFRQFFESLGMQMQT
ncbi:UDP-glucose--hexose-1-phosphate uridylyltransferase [Paenibacillus curdlanolyticus YK9]|uniref:Galactose-1-phosphate uridylyltransferase n=1 Tax=Paenibacillus curdlanolyticus YK9 TaxID=717606 RepID=E0I9U4_9BACL|nr:UDP-glucose--hexose-1-phosphate uridylyltransferase [Paenibacillus curdlanolyticus]EFM10521.1 UDP-glucose--hexose-1-phosphate uridylyltransferase [Paenibacillus curdlanolyticus YK9]